MSRLDDMNELLGKQEELDPELAECIEESERFGACIKHPLVYSMVHFPQLNATMNAQLKAKKAAIERARAEADWHSFIYLHERPYRLLGFTLIMGFMTDVQYWYNLSSIWMDSENIRQNPKVWEHLLMADRPQRDAMMDDDDKAALDAMPAVIPVYQGHTVKRHDGMSWTTDRAKAEWFAHRFSMFESSPPVLSVGSVRKINVIAYLSGRGESEIIAKRRQVKVTERIALQPKDDETSNTLIHQLPGFQDHN